MSGYHIREAGSTAVQELAFTIADGLAYADAAIARGLAIDDFAPRLSFFFVARTTLLEEVMTRDPRTARADNTFGYALLLMHENGFRHVPVVENGAVIGIVSVRNALDPELEEFVAETERRKRILLERA